MSGKLTLAIIKPHIIRERKCGQLIACIEDKGFAILLLKTIQLRKEGAQEFYKGHVGKPFFDNLVNVMISGPIWVMAISKDNAVEEWRNFIGATDPAKAEEGTLRREFGEQGNITNNAIHGSATDHDAQHEIGFFFSREITLAERIDALDNQQEIS